MVFHNTVPKGMQAQWSFTIQCQRGHKPNDLSQHNARWDASPMVLDNIVPKGCKPNGLSHTHAIMLQSHYILLL